MSCLGTVVVITRKSLLPAPAPKPLEIPRSSSREQEHLESHCHCCPQLTPPALGSSCMECWEGLEWQHSLAPFQVLLLPAPPQVSSMVWEQVLEGASPTAAAVLRPSWHSCTAVPSSVEPLGCRGIVVEGARSRDSKLLLPLPPCQPPMQLLPTSLSWNKAGAVLGLSPPLCQQRVAAAVGILPLSHLLHLFPASSLWVSHSSPGLQPCPRHRRGLRHGEMESLACDLRCGKGLQPHHCSPLNMSLHNTAPFLKLWVLVTVFRQVSSLHVQKGCA